MIVDNYKPKIEIQYDNKKGLLAIIKYRKIYEIRKYMLDFYAFCETFSKLTKN